MSTVWIILQFCGIEMFEFAKNEEQYGGACGTSINTDYFYSGSRFS